MVDRQSDDAGKPEEAKRNQTSPGPNMITLDLSLLTEVDVS